MIARFAIPFFFLMSLVVVPVVVALLLRWLAPRRRWKQYAAVSTFLIWLAVAWGYFVDFGTIEVHQVEYRSSDLPQAFDGYRILQFSDAHVDSYKGPHAHLLQQLVDSINAQHADAIVFTGDLQNLRPDELVDKIGVLSQLQAPDGVYAVLGNHDYATYLNLDSAAQEKNNLETQRLIRQTGWTLLMNEHRIIRRDADSIVIAGMENWGKAKRMPRRGNVKKTLSTPTALTSNAFIVMLQHDPTAWRKGILPESNAQLTLSGHTHGGQFTLFGWSPVAFTYQDWKGMSYEGDRALYVSSGVGALIPFRFNLYQELAVITLRTK